MKYTKKIMCLLVAFAAVIGVRMMVTATESVPGITLQVDKATVQVGDEVTVTIGTDQMISKIFGMGMDLMVDPDVFEYVSSAPAEEFFETNQIGQEKDGEVCGRFNIAKLDLTGDNMNISDTITTVVLRAKKEADTTNIRIENLEVTRATVSTEEMNVTVKTPEAISVKVNEKAEEPVPIKPVKVSKIKITGISQKIAAGKKIQLKASVTPSNAENKNVVWKSGNTNVATVNSKGLVTIKKNTGGKSVQIYASAKDGSGVKTSYKINSMKGVVKSIKISGAKNVKAGTSLKLKASVTTTKGANKALSWKSSNTKYATVKNGKVTTKKAGKNKKVTITAMSTDGSNKKKSVTIRLK